MPLFIDNDTVIAAASVTARSGADISGSTVTATIFEDDATTAVEPEINMAQVGDSNQYEGLLKFDHGLSLGARYWILVRVVTPEGVVGTKWTRERAMRRGGPEPD